MVREPRGMNRCDSGTDGKRPDERRDFTMKTKKFNARSMTLIGMLGALSTVLMMFHFPLPFAPSFLKFDIAELPTLFAGFFLEPASGCLVVVVKILLKLVMEGTDTAFVGEFMNAVGSSVFVLSVSLIYQFRRTKTGAVIGLSFASVLVSILFIYLNMQETTAEIKRCARIF